MEHKAREMEHKEREAKKKIIRLEKKIVDEQRRNIEKNDRKEAQAKEYIIDFDNSLAINNLSFRSLTNYKHSEINVLKRF